MRKNYSFFSDRKGRAEFIARTFRKEFEASRKVLDVGCDYNSLKDILGPKVTGVDLYGNPDYKIDFEREKLSRFKDNMFDSVVCTEVLEHLENLHEMMGELSRVSNRYIIVSLPNCMNLFTRISILFCGKAGKFYGLPNKRPDDRHRWFFSHVDIDQFFQKYAAENSLVIAKKFLHCNYSNHWKGKLTRIFVRFLDLDSASQSYWILLEKLSERTL